MANAICRSISDQLLEAFLNDFAFLFDKVRRSCGELDLRLRNDYFNLYYKGNSLAKVRVTPPTYQIEVHEKFAASVFPVERFGTPRQSSDGKNLLFSVSARQLRAFFSNENIKAVASRIAKR